LTAGFYFFLLVFFVTQSGQYLASLSEMEHERDTPLNSEEDARRNEINALLATTPRLKSMFELFQSGKSVPRQSTSTI
jgi:hypothetical protein